VRELSPLRPDSGDPREQVRQVFRCAAFAKAHPMPSAARVTKWTKAAPRMLAIADKVALPLHGRAQLEQLAAASPPPGRRLKVPDARFDELAWVCAFQAVLLVEQFSKKPPASTEDGNIHRITRLIYRSVSGGPRLENTELLGAVRSALA